MFEKDGVRDLIEQVGGRKDSSDDYEVEYIRVL